MTTEITYHYRVYFDDAGKVVSYAMTDVPEFAEYKWIEVTREQYAEANHNCTVVDKKLVKPTRKNTYLRLIRARDDDVHDAEAGKMTSVDDLCILAEDETIDKCFYKITTYEKIS